MSFMFGCAKFMGRTYLRAGERFVCVEYHICVVDGVMGHFWTDSCTVLVRLCCWLRMCDRRDFSSGG